MKFVTMYHPKLDNREASVPESSVPYHEKSGWKLKKAEQPAEQPADKPTK